jgi:hypothetical protein
VRGRLESDHSAALTVAASPDGHREYYRGALQNAFLGDWRIITAFVRKACGVVSVLLSSRRHCALTPLHDTISGDGLCTRLNLFRSDYD